MTTRSTAIIISPNYKNYAEKYLAECVASIRAQDYAGKMKVFLADNETSAESAEFIRKTAPEAELVLNKYNDGFAKGNNDCIRLALAEGFEYIILFNMDTAIDRSCVTEMVKAAEKDCQIGIVQARVMLYGEQDKINSLGNTTHFLGFGYSLGYRNKYDPLAPDYRSTPPKKGRIIIDDIHYPSGVAILFKRGALEKIGLFDEEYWMYNEDQEIGWRAWLKGYRVVLAPGAVVYHKYEFARSIRQYYFMDRNRILTILLCYKLPTLILIFPAFALMELGLILFSLKSGWFKEKIRVWAYFLRIKNWQYIIRARQRNQAWRQAKDREIVPLIAGRIWYQEIDDWKLRFINPAFDCYWKICKYIMFW